MSKNLVIVESPAKAKTLKKFLGSTYKIEATMGHVRDLPKSELGINIENDFEPKYITIRGKGELLSKLRKEVKNSDKIYLATDPDREGEAISWHLYHALKLEGKNATRITFNEITKNAVKKSIKEARPIDMNLVDSQQARRVLDRIVGYKISPLLWKKVKKGLSAGRVQSVTLRLICDREEEIDNFIPEEYWTIDVNLESKNKKIIKSKFYGTQNEKVEMNSKEVVDQILDEIKKNTFKVSDIKKGSRVRKPIPPFTTSTLQQEASKVLGFTTQKAMMVAQQLYEGIDVKGHGTLGLVSYIRTDSVRISDEAYVEAKKYIDETYGSNYSNPEKVEYKSKGKTQDAHEAIRPTYISMSPDSIKESLSKDQLKLYKIIWERFIGSQMAPAVYDTFTIKIDCATYQFRTTGSNLKFSGFLEVYGKNQDEEEMQIIPNIEQDEVLKLKNIEDIQHFTQAPPRYTEATIVKTLEEIGVGRPSTYSPTITTIVARGYVSKESKIFFPTELGEIVNDIMKNNFNDVINVDFTAQLEENLDKVEEGNLEWKEIVRQFYFPFYEELLIAEEKIGEIEIKDEETDVICENCGRNMVIKFGRHGKFLACPGFPECRNAKPYYEDAEVKCPLCDGNVLIKKTKKGRKYFGCDNNPECSFMSWNKPTGEKCPKCESPLVEKGTKTVRVVCSNSQCGYVAENE